LSNIVVTFMFSCYVMLQLGCQKDYYLLRDSAKSGNIYVVPV